VTPTGGVQTRIFPITGYPTIDGGIVFYFGATESTPFDFGDTGGDIHLSWRPRSDIITDIIVRITSGLPE